MKIERFETQHLAKCLFQIDHISHHKNIYIYLGK